MVRHLTRRLIWGVYSADNQLQSALGVAEDNSYSTADDDLFTLPEGDISLVFTFWKHVSTDAAAFVSFLPTTNCYHRSVSLTVTVTP